MRLVFILILLIPALVVAEDAPLKGVKEDYATFYTGVKRDGLEPFWKSSDDMEEYERQFIIDYRDMHEKKDVKMLNALIHPASLACENDKTELYFTSIREFYLNEVFPKTFEMKYFPIDPDKQWALKQRMEYPISPTHVLYIEYKDDGYIEGLQRFLRLEEYPEKRLYELVKCPSEASMAKMISEAENRLLAPETSGNQPE